MLSWTDNYKASASYVIELVKDSAIPHGTILGMILQVSATQTTSLGSLSSCNTPDNKRKFVLLILLRLAMPNSSSGEAKLISSSGQPS